MSFRFAFLFSSSFEFIFLKEKQLFMSFEL